MPDTPTPKQHGDVEFLDAQTIGANYGSLFKFLLRYRRFDGTWSAAVERDCFDSGPAVIVLPYNPQTDEVVLIKQFRTGPWVAGAEPWLYEAPAGRIDKPGATAKDIAISETREEAGLRLTAIERVAGFFTSPGIFSEHIDAFCGRFDEPARSGTFGLAEEHEDIKAEIFAAERAIALALSGGITSGPTLVLLLWFALNRDRLREAWRR